VQWHLSLHRWSRRGAIAGSVQRAPANFQENIIFTTRQQRLTIACLLAILPGAFIASTAQAQQYQSQNQQNGQANYGQRNAGPRIDGFNVDEVRRLTPGTELSFTIYGSPGGSAALRIAGAQRSLPLVETEPGQYTGTYVIGSRDKLSARSQVTGNLRVGNQVATAVLSESLQVGVGAHSARPGAVNAPQISRFEMQPVSDLDGGSELPFTLYGTPGGKADLTIAGVRGRFFLDEVNAGEYSGVYTVRRADRITPSSAVVATLHVGQQVTSATLRQPLLVASRPANLQAPVARVQKACMSCGTIEAINQIQVKGEAGYLGTIGGGLAGALVGSQIGGGNGRTAAEIAAAVGGAYAGREVERNARKTAHYEVVVRLDNGGTQTVTQEAEPSYRVGDKVRIADGQLARQ
jgi:outer membrane lipoprotein SlyB